LWIADVYGNEKRKLLSPPEHYQFAIKQFSQSGGQIYLLKYADDYSTSSIVAYDIKKSRMSELYTTKNIVLDFWLLPQGELILSQYPSATRMEIELVAVSIKQGGHHSEPQLIKKLEGNLAISLGADRSGNIVTVSIGQVNSSVYVGQLMDHERQLSNVQRLTFVNGISRPSDWLPDGKSVLFYSDRAGTFGIYSQAMNSTTATGLANDTHDYRWPFISPDGRWLYYFLFQASANGPPAKFELMRKPLNGNATEPVVSLAGTARGVRCATTTKACVLADFDEGQIIYSTIDLLSGEKHELARGQIAPSVEYYIWDLSPDGKYLAHINKANKANEIHITSLENSEIRSILSFPTLAELHSIRWDAKSQGFFAVTQGEGDTSILYHIDLGGGRRILDYQQPGAVAASPDVVVPSPDGKYLAMGAWVFNANAWMLVRNDN
jgi:Tol biopolymer transport system component